MTFPTATADTAAPESGETARERRPFRLAEFAPTTSWEITAIACLAAFAVYAIALWSPAIFNDADTFWHISAGQWMLTHHAVLDHDVFSRVVPGKPWITQEWLSEVAMATAYQLAGWGGVAILTGLAMATTITLLVLYLGQRLDPLPCLVALALSIACLMPDYLARPHILALPFLTAWVIGIVNAVSSHRKPSWLLLPIMTIWANLHGGFVFGLALLIPTACEAVLQSETNRRRIALQWAFFSGAAIAAALVNAHGFRGLLYPFELMQVQSLSAVGEWQALDLHQPNPVEFAALATAFIFIWRGIRVNPIRLLLLIALFHESLLHARYGLLLGITAPVVLADAVSAAMPREQRSAPKFGQARLVLVAFATAILICASLRLLSPIKRGDGAMSPIDAVASIAPGLAREPVFNDYAFGGFLIFNGIKPLVDSRADLYGDAWLADYWRVVSGDAATVDRVFRKYRVAWTLLQPGDPLVAVLDRRPGWRRLFTGRYAVVHADARSR